MPTITFDPTNDSDVAFVLGVLSIDTQAPKAAPAQKAKPATKLPEPVAEEPEEDLLGGGEVTMEDAVAKATELVSNGKAADVKKALAAVGAKRVSEVSEANLAAFVTSLG